MYDEHELSDVLSELATTLATDFAAPAVLKRLVERIVDVLPITSAGLSCLDERGRPRFVVASDADARGFESLQSALAEGPALAAYESGRPVRVPDLARDGLFPHFGAAAVEAGLGAVYAFPLCQGDRCLGVLDLYVDKPGELSPGSTEAAAKLAAVAAAYLHISQARTDAVRLRHTALHDELTGLANKQLLESRIRHASDRASRSGTEAAVIFIDLDDFKRVNDEHGHAAGDAVLREVARRLSAVVRPSDTLARIYGDEFVLLCEDLADDAAAQALLARVHGTFAEPFVVQDATVLVAASVGVAFAGPGTRLSSQHIIEADHAMYEEKATRSQLRPNRLPGAARKKSTVVSRDLVHALLNDELELQHQPLVRLADGVVTGFVSSPIWRRSDGVMAASRIFGLITDSGLLRHLFGWCRDRGLGDVGPWLACGERALDLHVVVPAGLMAYPDIVAEIAEGCRKAGIPPERLVVSLTDVEWFDVDHPGSTAALETLRSGGVKVSWTGFGSSAASLDSLHRRPLDLVQIDRSFLDPPDGAGQAPMMLEDVANLAQRLGWGVLIDGVDSVAARNTALQAGITHGTGLLFSPPLSATEVAALLSEPTDSLRLPLGGAPD